MEREFITRDEKKQQRRQRLFSLAALLRAEAELSRGSV
jgi:hypothetical protein